MSTGYDESFLRVAVPLPSPAVPRPLRELAYEHFTVVQDPERRLAAVTAVNIDGDALRDVARGDDWHLDARIPAEEQAGPELYSRNDLDRGHLVRRRDPVWGSPEVAVRANRDTFAYTNAAPQAGSFNQSKQLWLGLEDHVLEYARSHRHRVSVFTGPVFAADDPEYRGILIPRRFWKVACWDSADNLAAEGSADGLAAAGFVLDQTPALDAIDVTVLPGNPPPLGPFRTFQVPITDIADATGLSLGPLEVADRLLVGASARPGQPWTLLESTADITL